MKNIELIQLFKKTIFDDQFKKTRLGPEWSKNEGKGEYSLTDNPGHLRYIIDANHTARVAGSGQNYKAALWLVRPFAGKRWVLRTEITYNLRPKEPTNNRNMHFVVRAPGVNGRIIARIDRSVGVNDSNRGSNSLYISAGNTGKTVYFPNSSGSLPIEKWQVEIERNDYHISIKAGRKDSNPKIEYACEHKLASGVFGNKQEIEIEGDGWYGSNNPQGYADIDFINATGTSPIAFKDISIRYIDGVGEIQVKKLEACGIKTIRDMAFGDVITLGKRTGISIFTLYVWKKKAALVMSFKLKKSLVSNILKMRVDEIMAMSDKELSRKAKQPIKVILDLKMNIATLLVSLDNDIVKLLNIEMMAVGD
jgi:hypothetical protein